MTAGELFLVVPGDGAVDLGGDADGSQEAQGLEGAIERTGLSTKGVMGGCIGAVE